MPRASRNEIVGWMQGRLKVRVAAVPTDGRANTALEVFLAAELGLRRRQVRVVGGLSSQHKLIEIDGLERAELDRRLLET